MEIVCLRHAESENVLAGASGAVPAAALTALGREQARELGRRIPGITHAYASATVRRGRPPSRSGRRSPSWPGWAR